MSLVVPAVAEFAPAGWGLTQEMATQAPLKLAVGGALELLILPFAFIEQFGKLKFLSVRTRRSHKHTQLLPTFSPFRGLRRLSMRSGGYVLS